MKRTILFVISIFCLIALNQSVSAQEKTGDYCHTDRGHIFISPNIGYTYPLNMPDGISVLDLSFNMDEGYFVCKNLAAIVDLGVGYINTSIASDMETHYYTPVSSGKHRSMGLASYTTGTDGSSSSTFLFNYGFGLRYYIAGKVFVGASVLSSTKDFSNVSDYANFQLGYPFFLTEHLAIEASAGYLMGIGDAKGSKALQGKLGVSFNF